MGGTQGEPPILPSDRYRVERELGAGGMATVYLAEDLKHGRRVAIKVLRPELAAVIGAERFLREIKTIATLQHPHILGLIDSGEMNGTAWYAMPFVEGESLRDRLSREKQLPIGEAVRIASEIASALDYAHRHGIIHRDIKPENVLLHDGSALVADFGIALAVSSAGGSRMTETGMSLGTPHYMSPEQAMGEREITVRSDVYALGCVLYELLTGDPPFTGSTAQAIVAKMMTEKPMPPSRVRDTVPPAVEDAVLVALAKLPADRFATAAEFALALRDTGGTPRTLGATGTRVTAAGPAPRWSARGPLPWALAATAAAVLAVAGWWRSTPPAGVIRMEVRPSPGTQIAYPVDGVGTFLAISPDGRQLIYAASRGGSDWALYIRNLDQLYGRELPGTTGAVAPSFSPDGRWIGFGAADGSLKKIAVDGSSLTTICQLDASGIGGLTWTTNREIVFDRVNLSLGHGLWRVSSDGGEAVEFTRPAVEGERLQLSPFAAEAGRLIFYTSGRASNLDLKIGVITGKTGEARVLGLQGTHAVGLANGYLLYVRGDGALMAAPFNDRALTAGPPLQLFDSIGGRNWTAPISLAADGSLFYQRGGLNNQLVRVDGHGVATVLTDSARAYAHPRLSPDGRRLAFEVQGAGGIEIWIADLAAHGTTRLTREGYNDRPEWTPDGRRILFSTTRTKVNSLWSQVADGSAPPELVYQGPDEIREGVFTPRGDAVVYRTDTQDRNRDIFLLPLSGTRQPVPLLASVDDDKQPRVSPDGKWLAYVSNESGKEEVYIRPMAGGPRVAVSVGGGGEPLWAPDGKRLYYRAGARLMAVHVATAPGLEVSAREEIFEGPYSTSPYHANYDVAPDGRSFIMVRPVEQNRQLILVVNWIEELRRRTR